LSVAVSVTVFAVFTGPTSNWNCPKAKPEPIVKLEGMGAATGSLLERLITAPPAGAGPVS
jgi:hypothetical protein